MSKFVTYPKKADGNATIRRFEPAYWTVDFPISMMATAITTGPNALRVMTVFRFDGDLMGLIWDTEDRNDAGIFGYPRRKDYRGTVLEFDWLSTGIRALDLLQGPNLVVETFAGETFNVRLWNYATSGTPTDCHIRLELGTVKAGFDADADVPWGNVKRLWISLNPEDYVKDGTTQIGETPGQLDLSNITVTGANATLPIRTTPLDAHALRMTDGFDNAYPFTPERLADQVHALGYRDWNVLYMGISKFHSLSWDAGEGRYAVDPAKPKFNAPTEQWLTDFFTRLHADGFKIIISVSFEILGMYMPAAWNQRDHAGNLARTGWEPPSGLIRPTSQDGLDYLRDVFLAALALLPVGAERHFQIGEPWWWDGSFGNNAPYIYDADTLTLYNSETGLFAVEPHLETIFGQPDPAHLPYLQWCRDQLGVATGYLRDEVLETYSDATSYLLIFTPQVLRTDAPMLRTLNFPQADWQAPAFDVLQIEDYDWVIEQRASDLPKTWLLATSVLGYAKADIHYFAGFILLQSTTWIWRETDKAIWRAFQETPAEVFVWSREQVMRDGWLFDRQSWKVYPPCTRLATCWKITRADGVVEGYTSFDAPLQIGGVNYESANGFTTSQLSADVEMSVADVEVLGAMDADGISADALLAGVYDHAEVEMFVVDWGDLTIPKTIVRRGWTGTITQAGQAFTVELRGLGQRIQQPVIDSYSAECRVHLFSPKCGVNRAVFAVNATVTALNDGSLGATSDNRIFYADALVQDDGWFDYGELWWTTGASAGLKTEVRAFTSDGRVELWEPMGPDIEIGDQFTIHAGCDKRRETCSAKFNNIVNLRAEPDLPGQDAVTAYPDPKA